MYDVLNKADAIVLCTEWSMFRSPDFEKIKSLMRNYNIFDGKNIYNSNVLHSFGFNHFQIGVKK